MTLRAAALAGVIIALIFAACGGGDEGSPEAIATAPAGGEGELDSLQAYFRQIEGVLEATERQAESLPPAPSTDAELPWDEQLATSEIYFSALGGLYDDFLAGLMAIEPPEETREPHTVAIEALTDILVLQAAQADKLLEAQSADEQLDIAFEGIPELRMLNEAVERLVAACQSLQSIADENNLDVDVSCLDEEADAGPVNATLTIGNETWKFSEINCFYSAEEVLFSSDSRESFILSSFGETDAGARTQLFVNIRDRQAEGRREGPGTTHSVTVTDIDNLNENQSVAWEASSAIDGRPKFTIQVDGKDVTAEALFDDRLTESVVEQVPGNFRGTCP